MHGYLFLSRHRNMEHALFEGSVLAKSVLNLIRIEAVFNLGFFIVRSDQRCLDLLKVCLSLPVNLAASPSPQKWRYIIVGDSCIR